MVADLKRSRPDIVYLRRRLRVEKTASASAATAPPASKPTTGIVMPPRPERKRPANQTSPSPQVSTASPISKPGGGISLGRPAPAEPVSQPEVAADVSPKTSGISLKAPGEQVQETKLPIPLLEGNIILGKDSNVVRLSRLQSAIGSLAILNGAYAAWEETDRSTGFLYANDAIEASTVAHSFKDGKDYPPLPEVHTKKYGNRYLVEFHKGGLVVNLRHFDRLKRLIVAPEAGKDLVIGTLSGASATLPYRADRVLYLSIVGRQAELRVEDFRGSIYETYRIGTYHPPAVAHAETKTATGNNDLQNFFSNVR